MVSNNEQLSSDSGIASHANNLAKKGKTFTSSSSFFHSALPQ